MDDNEFVKASLELEKKKEKAQYAETVIEKYKEEKDRYQRLRFSHAVSSMDQPHKMKESRRLIAFYLTELNARRIQFETQAINKGE